MARPTHMPPATTTIRLLAVRPAITISGGGGCTIRVACRHRPGTVTATDTESRPSALVEFGHVGVVRRSGPASPIAQPLRFGLREAGRQHDVVQFALAVAREHMGSHLGRNPAKFL